MKKWTKVAIPVVVARWPESRGYADVFLLTA
jgi:hypothetical protein